MAAIDSIRGRAVLTISHVAGMVDMVALPIWVGTLVAHYQFDPQQSGGLVTLFLMAVVLASVMLAPRFDQMPRRWMTTLGYSITTIAFFPRIKSRRVSDAGCSSFYRGAGRRLWFVFYPRQHWPQHESSPSFCSGSICCGGIRSDIFWRCP